MNLLTPLVTILFMILPVLSAGITFIFILKIKLVDFLSFPLDFKFHFRRKRLFGKNKTLKGPLVMSLCAAFYGWLLNASFGNPLRLSEKEVAVNFFLIGLFYSIGELPNSFFKRQLGIPPGKPPSNITLKIIFRTIDTFDSLIFCGVGYILFFQLPFLLVVLSVLIGGILHLSTDQFMTALSLKSKT